MNAEERTDLLMKIGYLLDINVSMWVGSVTPYPEDLGVGVRMLPSAMPMMCVMPKPWVKKVLLLRGSQRRSLGMTMSHAVMFEGGQKRFVLSGAAQAVADSLDKSSVKLSKYYGEAADNLKELHRLSRQILSKNSDYIWRTVSHLFPQYPDKLRAPDVWKGAMLDAIINKRFPSEERLRKFGVTYSIYQTMDTSLILGGKRQRPYPGLVKDCSNLSRALQENGEELPSKVMGRVLPMLREYNSKGMYAITINHLYRDLMRARAYNPVPIEGYDLLTKLDSLEARLDGIDMLKVRYSKAYRLELVDEIKSLAQFMGGDFKKDRKDKYLELFGPIH
jgi:hypothetical protein